MTPIHLFKYIFSNKQIELYVKRDDLYPIVGGGSKGRKLDLILPNAKKTGFNAVVTAGSNQSNHVRSTA